MKNIIRKIIYEPLFHFLLLGGFLYFYFDVFSTTSSDTKTIISISQNNLQHTAFIEDGVPSSLRVKKEFQDKVLLHEAYKQGLYEEDKVVRGKILTKMKFIVENSEVLKEPTEEELLAYYKKNIDTYSKRKSISFSNIFFKNIDKKEEVIIYEFLQDEDGSVVHDFSLIFPEKLMKRYENISKEELELLFGKYFTLKIMGQKKGVFSKIIPSSYGSHFIYIDNYKVGESYSFDEVIDRVYRDYKDEKLAKKRKKYFLQLEDKYTLEVIND